MLTKKNYLDRIHGMMGEMRLREEDWRVRVNWRQKILGKIQKSAGRCDNFV